VGHNGGDHTARFADSKHVLGEHEVTLLARGGTPSPAKALGELHIAFGVVLAERRIGDDAVEAFQFAGLLVLGVEQRVLELDVRTGHAVQKHVQPADGPCGGVIDLATEAKVRGVTAGLLDEFAADDEHAARTTRGVIHAHARRGFQYPHHEADDIARRIEVTTLLTRRLGEHVDEKLVGRAEQIGELEILVAKAVLAEVADKVLAALVRDQALRALRFQETYVVKNVFKGFIGLTQCAQCGIKDIAVGNGGIVEFILNIFPPGAFRDEEAVVIVRIFSV
jgi:hypothetical protein